MEQTRTDLTRNVRVRYESGDYGVALSIYDVLDEGTDDTDVEHIDGGQVTDTVEDHGLLTVATAGVTTLELHRDGAGPSILIWDDAEVDWATLKAS